jgi:LysR family transcriptional activator of nhaA
VTVEWLNYHHLLYFWAVAREGSLTAASRRLHLTPQTVSAQIRALEDRLGERLLERRGRGLVLTERGRLAHEYAGRIFGLGQEMLETLRETSPDRPLTLAVGVVDVVPKLVAHRLLRPAFRLARPVRVTCREARSGDLLAQLAVQGLDVVLSDTPLPPGVGVRAFNHLLGESGVTFLAAPSHRAALRGAFPECLDGADFLFPTEDTVLRRSLEQWFEAKGVQPRLAAEFQDSALLKVFGQEGEGVFCVPSIVEDDVIRQYGVEVVGRTADVTERFYAISGERRVKHPAVAAVIEEAKGSLFAE